MDKFCVAAHKINSSGESRVPMAPGTFPLSLGPCNWGSVMLYCQRPCGSVSLGEVVHRQFVALRTNEEWSFGGRSYTFVASLNMNDGGPLLHVFEITAACDGTLEGCACLG